MSTTENTEAASFEIGEIIGQSGRRRATFEARLSIAQAGRLIKSMREAAGLNQKALASAIGSSQAHISDLERGVGPQGPSVAVMARIAHACGMHLTFCAHASEGSEARAAGRRKRRR